VLTIGIAVDSNVLIYERIREESRNGRSPVNAIENGFKRALATVLDSNISPRLSPHAFYSLSAADRCVVLR
jgi:preprotein translocase subunit SecD